MSIDYGSVAKLANVINTGIESQTAFWQKRVSTLCLMRFYSSTLASPHKVFIPPQNIN